MYSCWKSILIKIVKSCWKSRFHNFIENMILQSVYKRV